MLDDLFSHKIHATNIEDWTVTLVKLAQVYERLDGRPYNRALLEDQLALLAPYALRSAFRDQFSIYMSVLGVGQIIWSATGWQIRVSETARRFLLVTEPDVEAFCRLQLALYQRPDGRGMSYEGSGRHEPLSAVQKLELIRQGYRVCPFRLILRMIKAKASLDGVNESDVVITPEEIYALVNEPGIRTSPVPPYEVLMDGLSRFRRGQIETPEIGRKTFKFLESTGLLTTDVHANIRLRDCGGQAANDARDLEVDAIRELAVFFDGFYGCTTANELVTELKTRRWANYFDAVTTLEPATVERIAGVGLVATLTAFTQAIAERRATQQRPSAPAGLTIQAQGRERRPARTPQTLADPEQTRIKRERRNAYHDLIVELLAAKIQAHDLEPRYTPFIDLFTNLNSVRDQLGGRFSTRGSYLDGQDLPYFPAEESDEVSFLFEAKSSDDVIIVDQVRRAVGQLYEYRFRYGESALRRHVVLVLALQSDLTRYRWIAEYLLSDRRIGVCWLSENLKGLVCPRECMPVLEAFVDDYA